MKIVRLDYQFLSLSLFLSPLSLSLSLSHPFPPLSSSPFPSLNLGVLFLSSSPHPLSIRHYNFLRYLFFRTPLLSICHHIRAEFLRYLSFSLLGICREHGKQYAMYLICVQRTNADGTVDKWDVCRRYSDFHDLHMIVMDRVSGDRERQEEQMDR